MDYTIFQITRKVYNYIREIPSIILRLINFSAGLLEFLIFVRLALIFSGANRAAPFAEWLYGYTDSFVLPFSGLFNDIYILKDAAKMQIETASLAAMVGYAIFLFIILKLIDTLKPPQKSPRSQAYSPKYY